MKTPWHGLTTLSPMNHPETRSWIGHDKVTHTGKLVETKGNKALYYFSSGMMSDTGKSRSYYQVYIGEEQDVNGFFKNKIIALQYLRE